MSSGLNREIHLAARPQGWPTLDTFALVETPIPEPTEGQVLVRNVFKRCNSTRHSCRHG